MIIPETHVFSSPAVAFFGSRLATRVGPEHPVSGALKLNHAGENTWK